MKKTLAILCLILALTLVGCSNSSTPNENLVDTDNTVQETPKTESVDNVEQIISAINEALDELSLTNNYSSIIAKKDKSLITVYIKTSDYIWDNVQKNSTLKNSYKADFSTIYNKALETAKSVETNNIPTIGILVQEPDGSNLAAVSGTSNVTFLFE